MNYLYNRGLLDWLGGHKSVIHMPKVALHYFVTIPYFIPKCLKYYKNASKTS